MNNYIKDYCCNNKSIKLYKNAVIYEDDSDKWYVIKDNKKDIVQLFKYLNSRGFKYIPNIIYADKNIYKYEYINDINTPLPQRISDIIKLDATLHSKTVYYTDVSIDEIKELYERLNGEINDTFRYYDDLITSFEGNIYMSPSQYLLARNCTMVFNSLNICKNELDKWYDSQKGQSKKRVVLLHNNLKSDHLIKGDHNVLISWDKACQGIPIYDFINIYKNNYDSANFKELYISYNKIFPLLDEEVKLLFVFLLIPNKISFISSELEATKDVTNLCNYLSQTIELFMKEYKEKNQKQDNDINKEQKDMKSNAEN